MQQSQKPDVWDKVLHAARRFLPNRTDFGSARSLYFNCKQQAENSLWHTREHKSSGCDPRTNLTVPYNVNRRKSWNRLSFQADYAHDSRVDDPQAPNHRR